MKVLPPIIPNDANTEHTLYNTQVDSIKAKFTGWHEDASGPSGISDYYITKIKITNSTFDKKIELVNYCEKSDSIEIHFYEKSPDKFKEVEFPLTNCKLETVRVFLLIYKTGESIELCSSAGATISQPKTKRGNIIVGNP
nr:hypothetical protein [uncultured Psychroserpens sp.]